MKERPILFSTPMVIANLAGLKTQTRRAVKFPLFDKTQCFELDESYGNDLANPRESIDHLCPYGKVGDQLWVKETFYAYGKWEWRHNDKKQRKETYFVDMTMDMDRLYQYAAEPLQMTPEDVQTDKLGWYKRPSIFMPRKASRITLEITGIRVERLQDISEADAEAEGVLKNWCGDLSTGPNGFGGTGWVPDCGWINYQSGEDGPEAYTPKESYQTLWDSINGDGSWDANPWVWVVEYKVINPVGEAK
ncbi:MAG TPA: hypothetical protein VK958_06370 [Methylophilus sp.]|uniref:hypothetical protein n=1 Tax=Methylophilus sp. TaxID=29541 RepID=UPI002C7D30D1|nr:hypothetical protein [Methylophilus sp.]HSH86859.1 hypothetical protein [Methylophilus sp.]